ncbi:MAG: AAA family ATPase, partial [Firmicutes bacterium]|nr:AAA family ATPase [Bacillota bacterium]
TAVHFLQELEQEVAALALSLEEQRRGLGQRQAERKTLEESLQVLQTEIRTAELRTVGLEQEGAALRQARERMLQDLDYLKAAQEELRREDRQKGDEIQAEEAVLAGLLGEETRLKTSLEGQQEGLKEEIRRRELLQERLTELKVEVARSRQEEAGLASNLEALNKRLEELRKEGREKERELREVQSRRQELELARQHYQEEKDKWEKARLAGDTELRSREEQREVLVREMNRLEREIKAQRRGLETEKEALQTSEVQAARLEVARDGLGEKLLALGVEPGAVTSGRKRRWEAAERERLQQEIQDLAAKIEALGPVSLGAIEEYRELSQRLHFLKHQQLDLEKSREALLRLVEEMDREMKRLFAETFATVRVYFRQIFQELFGGGTADLKLEDPENLLETGVEVVAQPPGKKLQSLSLLSGGEKALASIALLFALLRTRPSAFLVLDEIEASLDEANVERFAAYIRGLAEKIQFILITHQRKTMETARALYGISMEEMGVSRLVSLRLVAKTG